MPLQKHKPSPKAAYIGRAGARVNEMLLFLELRFHRQACWQLLDWFMSCWHFVSLSVNLLPFYWLCPGMSNWLKGEKRGQERTSPIKVGKQREEGEKEAEGGLSIILVWEHIAIGHSPMGPNSKFIVLDVAWTWE